MDSDPVPLYNISRAERFAAGVSHPEGVVVDREGRLYTGSASPDYLSPGPIYRISPDGSRFEPFAAIGGRVLGLAFDRSGDLYACDGYLGAVFRISPAGEVALFAGAAAGRKLQKPNFLVFDAQGGLYVSDSGTARAGEPTGAIFYFQPDGQARIFLDELVFPNGLALARGDQELYVVLTRDDRVLRLPVASPGVAGAPALLAADLNSGPDGLAVDVRGNVYVTLTRTNQLVSVSPQGEQKLLLADPSGDLLHAPSNLAFGGPELRDLVIANLFGQHLTRLRVDIPGLPLYHHHDSGF